jgi:hypothetical protein
LMDQVVEEVRSSDWLNGRRRGRNRRGEHTQVHRKDVHINNWWFHLRKLGLVDDGSACVVGS